MDLDIAITEQAFAMAEQVGVILAGGRSSRMGADKAEMRLMDELLVSRSVRRLAPVVDDVLVIGPQSLQVLVPTVRVVGDLIPAIGPLGGLYTALSVTTCPHIFLVACDMPFVQPGLVRAMLARARESATADAVILPTHVRAQPLHAVYARGCLPAVERALASDDHSLRTLLSRLLVATVDAETFHREDPRGVSVFNVNTPADWDDALRMAEKLDS